MNCNLCRANAEHFFTGKNGEYFRCERCLGIFLSPEDFLDEDEEKARYETHNNDITDPRYQKFGSPIINAIADSFSTEQKGLDFGCGTGPVIQHLLHQKGFSVDLYDPFFRNNPSVLNEKYDFIVCCEVIEHFHQPAEEFPKLYKLLNSGGKLFCMTHLYTDETNFENWYYKDDHTHVFFYHPHTIRFIRENFGFTDYQIKDRLIIFTKS